MSQFTIFALIIQMISSNQNAYATACADPMVYCGLMCADNLENGIYHLYMGNPSILREVPLLVEEATINSIKDALAMKDHQWRDLGRASLEDIANNVRIELSGRPVISWN